MLFPILDWATDEAGNSLDIFCGGHGFVSFGPYVFEDQGNITAVNGWCSKRNATSGAPSHLSHSVARGPVAAHLIHRATRPFAAIVCVRASLCSEAPLFSRAPVAAVIASLGAAFALLAVLCHPFISLDKCSELWFLVPNILTGVLPCRAFAILPCVNTPDRRRAGHWRHFPVYIRPSGGAAGSTGANEPGSGSSLCCHRPACRSSLWLTPFILLPRRTNGAVPVFFSFVACCTMGAFVDQLSNTVENAEPGELFLPSEGQTVHAGEWTRV